MTKSVLFLGIFLALGQGYVYADKGTGEFQDGMNAYHWEDWKSAISYMEIVVQKDSQNWKAYQILGYSYYKMGNSQKALAACDKSLEINPENLELEKFEKKLKKQEEIDSMPPAPVVNGSALSGSTTHSNANLLPEHEKSLYFNIGYSSPFSPAGFSSGWTSGFSGGAGIGFGLSRISSLIIDLNFSSLPLNQAAFPGYTVQGGNISDVLLMLNAKIRFLQEDNPVVPYGTVGLGISFYNATPATFNGPTSFYTLGLNTTDFAFRLALGIDIRLSSKAAIAVESNGVGTSTSLTSIVYSMLHAGLKLNL